MQFTAKKYSNGAGYSDDSLWLLYPAGSHRAVGGVRKTKNGKFLAFAGLGAAGKSVKIIMDHADKYIWADDLRAALAAIKPSLEG